MRIIIDVLVAEKDFTFGGIFAVRPMVIPFFSHLLKNPNIPRFSLLCGNRFIYFSLGTINIGSFEI